MKFSRIMLTTAALATTVITAFAFRTANKIANGTLATFSNGAYHNVACIISGSGNGNLCADITYYTRGAAHTKLGKFASNQVTE